MTRATLNKRQFGGINLLEGMILVAITVLLMGLILPAVTGYNPKRDFEEKCEKAGGVTVTMEHGWTCFAKGVVLPVK